jgi:hypothetical protein
MNAPDNRRNGPVRKHRDDRLILKPAKGRRRRFLWSVYGAQTGKIFAVMRTTPSLRAS